MASQAAADAAVLILQKRGFTEVQEINGLAVGARVRSVSEQYSEAYRKGTGTIERIFHKEGSSWAQKHQRPDIELIIKRDYPETDPGNAYRFLSDYHVAVVEAPAESAPTQESEAEDAL